LPSNVSIMKPRLLFGNKIVMEEERELSWGGGAEGIFCLQVTTETKFSRIKRCVQDEALPRGVYK